MLRWVWFLCAADSRSNRPCRLRSVPPSAPLGQLHDHGGQLGWVSADGRVSNGWSNGANTQHQTAAVIVGGHAALVSQACLRALTVVRQCSSNSTVLKRRKKLERNQLCISYYTTLTHGDILISTYKELCTSCLHGSGSVSPFGDILSPGPSRVLSRSSARR